MFRAAGAFQRSVASLPIADSACVRCGHSSWGMEDTDLYTRFLLNEVCSREHARRGELLGA